MTDSGESRLGREAQVGGQEARKAPSGPALVPLERELSVLDQSMLEAVDDPAVSSMIARMMEGLEPLSRPLHPGEPRKFNAQNINVVLARAAGFKPAEISTMFSIHQEYVNRICRHPYGRKLFQTLIPLSMRTSLTVKGRISTYASDMLERIYDVGMTTDDPNVVRSIGFGLLDRAGFGAVTKTESKHTVSFEVTPAVASQLEVALAESRQIDAGGSHVLPAGSEAGSSQGTAITLEPTGDSMPQEGSQSGSTALVRRVG